MPKRPPIGFIVLALLVVVGVLGWMAIPARPLEPTLPEIGPGAKRRS